MVRQFAKAAERAYSSPVVIVSYFKLSSPLVTASALFIIVLQAGAIIDPALQMQLGNPSSATADANNHSHYLIQRAVEALDYNDSLGVPNWASWDLTASDIGSSGRSPVFFVDTNLPAGFYKVGTGEYSGSGYDRGHLCPSADRTDSVANNDAVFYMSNIMPQAPENNQGVWATFEGYCRTLAQSGNELLIICGPGGFGANHLTTSTHVFIPTNTWKIVVVVPAGNGTALSRITATNRVISLEIPNTSTVSNSWQGYITSARQIELDTGFTFFTALPGTIASALRSKIDGLTNPPPPAITSFSPASGDVNSNVVITGTNFDSATAVRFNGTSATYIVDSTTQITTTVPTNATSGQFTVTTPGGTATSAGSFTDTIAGATPPVITAQPQSLTVTPGQNAMFTVTASGTAPLSYQWRFNGTNLSGATLTSYTRTNVQPVDAGNYSVLITNSLGSVTSSIATLTVNISNTPPAITTQPQSLTVLAGQTATFGVTATGSTPLNYQWRFNGTNLNGANSTNLTRLNAQPSDAGIYSVVVTNGAGSVTSSNAALTIVTNAPGGILARWNFNNTSVSVTSPPPSTGTGTLTLVDGTTSAFVSGTGSSDTSVSNSAWNTASYPPQGTGNKSAGAQFKINTMGFQNLALSWDQRVSATASKYFRLQLTTNGTDFMDFNVVAMTNNTVFEAKTNNLATWPGVNNNPNFGFRIVSEFESSAAGTANANYVTVGTSYSTAGTVRFDIMTLYATPIPSVTPPGITNQPQSVTVIVGDSVTFTVGATGTAPLSYQWQLASTNLPAAINAMLTLTSVSGNQAGNYRVVVTDSAGSLISSNAVLSAYATAAAALNAFTYAGSQFQFNVTGVSGFNYAVQASTNLVNWTSLQTNASPFTFTDAATFPERFYRAVWLP